MSRQILREQEREETKMQKWFNNFTPSQARFHKELVRKIVQDTQDKTEVILDSCYIGAILQHTEIELSECIKIAKLANVNMEETSKYLNKEREYYTMIEDTKIRTNIREAAKKLQIEGIKLAPGIKELRKLYNFPQKDIHIIWAEGTQEIKADKAKEEIMQKIGENNDKILNKNIEIEEKADKELKEVIKKHLPKEEISYAVTEKEIEEKRTITITPTGIETNRVFKETKLKIKSIEIEGTYGTYVKSSNGVVADGNPIKDIEMLNRERESYLKRQAELTTSAENRIKELKEHLEKLLIDKENEANKYEEIKQVFAM